MARPKKTEPETPLEAEEISDFGDAEALVPKQLLEHELAQRRVELANSTVKLLDLEELRTRNVKRANETIKELKQTIRKLAGEVRTGVTMVPAQLAFSDALESRDASVRPLHERGRAVREP